MSEALANLHPDLRALVGSTIAERYRIDSVVGIGGMGAVFRAHHLGLKRDVAIKILHPDLSRDEEVSARFDREAHSASRLDHPNCLQVTDYGSTEDGMKYMVMQLLEGGELSARLGRAMPPASAVELTLQILRGLDHAHKKGIVHRDVKPENIFVTTDHEGDEALKLVDFGIAKIVDGPTDGPKHRTKAGLVFGTPAYMSPEQAAGVAADERSDLYSAGIILYQMLAGRLPFDHEDPVALVRMQVSVDPPPLPSNVPPVLAAAIERLLAKNRDERFQTAAEAVETLEQLLPMLESGVIDGIELPAIVRAATAPLRTHATVAWTRAVRSRRVAAVAGGLVVLLVAWIMWPEDEASKADNAASDSPVTVQGEVPMIDPTEGPPRPGIPSADAAKLAEVDRMLLAGQLDEADKVLTALRDQYPDDPVLLWRQGRLLAKRRRKEAQALGAYGAAIDHNAGLLEDRDFYAELYELLRNRRIRDEALDLALHKMGEHGHKFLLEVVNDQKNPLGYSDRHRALDELSADEESTALVNRQLNLALDLLQATQSLTPCAAYKEALEQIAADPDLYYYNRVKHASVPEPPPEDAAATEGEQPQACEGLAERRDQVLEMLAALGPIEGESDGADASAEPPSEPPPDAKKSANKSSSKKKKKKQSNDCDKPFAIFSRKCRK